MLVVRLTFSLLMLTFNLMVSLLVRGARRSARGNSYSPRTTGAEERGNHSLGVLLAIVFGVFILLAVDPRLSALPPIIVGVVWLVRRRSTRQMPAASELAQLFKSRHLMSGPQFEAFMANVFKALGYRTSVLGGSGDQGVDILLVDRNGQRIAVQCKNHSKRVGNRPVQEVFAGMKHHRCDQAWVVAPTGYTKGAYDLARSVDVSLFDDRNIERWISQAGDTTPVPDRATQSAAALRQASSAPTSVPRRESPNLEVKKNRQSNDGPKRVNTGGTERDRREYEELLDRYGSLLRSMDIRTTDLEKQHRHPGLSPRDRKQYREQGALALQKADLTRRMLDYLEERNPELTSGELGKRRAKLNRKQVELEKRSKKLGSKKRADKQVTERKSASQDFKPLDL